MRYLNRNIVASAQEWCRTLKNVLRRARRQREPLDLGRTLNLQNGLLCAQSLALGRSAQISLLDVAKK
ncbi:MAG TPA: hypothetical protein DD490_05980 [Acidobacteria bacterium]|nr:hypothetical protein [Acidobacteriota bacterium]